MFVQRLLPGHGNRDLFRHPPMTAVYSIRPYCPEDKVRMADFSDMVLYLVDT